jgi:hypothetical protein
LEQSWRRSCTAVTEDRQDDPQYPWRTPADAFHAALADGNSAVGSAAAHISVIAPHLKEAPYMGVLFILLTIACIAMAMAAITYDARIRPNRCGVMRWERL